VRIAGIAERYQRPGWFTTHVFNRAVAVLTHIGLSVAGSRVLEVRGRKTGEPRRTPVNLLTLEGTRYLVAPRGHTQWVRNLRAQGEGRLLLGRRAQRFTAVELPDDDKVAILRAYLERWKWEVGAFFDGVGPTPPTPSSGASRPTIRSSASNDQPGERGVAASLLLGIDSRWWRAVDPARGRRADHGDHLLERLCGARSERRLPGVARVAFELTAFALAVVALLVTDAAVVAVVFAALVAANTLLLTVFGQCGA
jgi:deazaflavin-dependent oxidoreductase (nitroreductase family)